MDGKAIGRLRLILAGVATLCTQSAAAGLMQTVDALTDFQFDGSQVVYDLKDQDHSPHPSTTDPGREGVRRRKSGDGQGATSTRPSDLYLTARSTDADAIDIGELQILRGISSDSDTLALLKETVGLEQVGGSAGDFSFLVEGDAVDGSLAPRYRHSGLSVAVRVADPKSIGLVNTYDVLSDDTVPDRAVVRKPVPVAAPVPVATPVPAPLALLLLGGIPLATLLRRYR